MNLFHKIAMYTMSLFVIYAIFAVIRIVWHFFRYFLGYSDIFLVHVKRAVLLPTRLIIEAVNGILRTNVTVHIRIFYLFLAILVCLEGYRYSGYDLKIGSYTEYPFAQTCMAVQVHDVWDDTSKYYSLPAAITRDEDENGNAAHIIERAYWSNDGYLDFTGPHPVEVLVGVPSIGYDQDGYKWEIILTNVPAEHPKIPVTQSRFNILVLFYIIAAFFLIVGIFNFTCPPADDIRDDIQIVYASDLPPDLKDVSEQLMRGLAECNHMFLDEYLSNASAYLTGRWEQWKTKHQLPLPESLSECEKVFIYMCANDGYGISQERAKLHNQIEIGLPDDFRNLF